MNSRFLVFASLGTLVSVFVLMLYHWYTPLFHWTVKLENLYRSIFLFANDDNLNYRRDLQYLFVIALSYTSLYLGMELRSVTQRLGYFLGAIFLVGVISPIAAFSNLLFEPFSGWTAIVLAGGVGTLTTYLFAPVSHPLRRYFAGRISQETFAEMTHPQNWVNLHGKKELTVINCRMLNYSGFVSDMTAEELEKMGSLFLKSVAEFLVERGAYLDACNSQGVRVFVGFTDERGDHAERACHMALELKKRLINLEAEMDSLWHHKVSFGVSLATGELSLGLFGYREFEFYSAVGESVDYCRRICGLNEIYGSYILMDATTFQRTRDLVEVRPMEMVYSPRTPKLNEIYELLAEKGELSEDEVRSRDAFWAGVIFYRKDELAKASAEFKKASIESRVDLGIAYYLELIQQRQQNSDQPAAWVESPVVPHARELKF